MKINASFRLSASTLQFIKTLAALKATSQASVIETAIADAVRREQLARAQHHAAPGSVRRAPVRR